MNTLTVFGACAVAMMLFSYALEQRSTWPFGVVEGVWALVALRRWWIRRTQGREQALSQQRFPYQNSVGAREEDVGLGGPLWSLVEGRLMTLARR